MGHSLQFLCQPCEVLGSKSGLFAYNCLIVYYLTDSIELLLHLFIWGPHLEILRYYLPLKYLEVSLDCVNGTKQYQEQKFGFLHAKHKRKQLVLLLQTYQLNHILTIIRKPLFFSITIKAESNNNK